MPDLNSSTSIYPSPIIILLVINNSTIAENYRGTGEDLLPAPRASKFLNRGRGSSPRFFPVPISYTGPETSTEKPKSVIMMLNSALPIIELLNQ